MKNKSREQRNNRLGSVSSSTPNTQRKKIIVILLFILGLGIIVYFAIWFIPNMYHCIKEADMYNVKEFSQCIYDGVESIR